MFQTALQATGLHRSQETSSDPLPTALTSQGPRDAQRAAKQ